MTYVIGIFVYPRTYIYVFRVNTSHKSVVLCFCVPDQLRVSMHTQTQWYLCPFRPTYFVIATKFVFLLLFIVLRFYIFLGFF